jgi:hypothetical protein
MKNQLALSDAITNGEVVTIKFYPSTNYYYLLSHGGPLYALMAVGITYAVACTLLACWKMYKFIKHKGVELTSPQICLALEIFAGVERAVYLIDPIYTTGIFPRPLAVILSTFHVSISVITSLTIAFYWHAVLKKRNVDGMPALKKWKWPFIISGVLIIVLHFVSTSLDAALIEASIVLALELFLQAFVTLAVAIFFLATGIRILKVFTAGTKTRVDSAHSLRKVRRVTIYIICGSVGMMIVTILLVGLGISSTSESAWTIYILFSLLILTIQTVGLTHILALNAPDGPKSSESGTGNSSPKGSNIDVSKSDSDSGNTKSGDGA